MPLYPASEARSFVKPELLDNYDQAVADTEAEGKRLTGVFIANGVPVVYNIEDKD